MFHDMEVKMRNTTAISRPAGWPWNVDTKNTRAAGKNPRIGTLWRMSSGGSITTAARLLRAMVVPYATAKTRARRYAATMRPRENRERRGRTAACFALSGNAIANAIPTAMTTSATHRTHFRAAAIGMAPREGAYL